MFRLHRLVGGIGVLAPLAASDVGRADAPDWREGWRAGCHYCDVAFVADMFCKLNIQQGCRISEEKEVNSRIPDPEIDGEIYSSGQ